MCCMNTHRFTTTKIITSSLFRSIPTRTSSLSIKAITLYAENSGMFLQNRNNYKNTTSQHVRRRPLICRSPCSRPITKRMSHAATDDTRSLIFSRCASFLVIMRPISERSKISFYSPSLSQIFPAAVSKAVVSSTASAASRCSI